MKALSATNQAISFTSIVATDFCSPLHSTLHLKLRNRLYGLANAQSVVKYRTTVVLLVSRRSPRDILCLLPLPPSSATLPLHSHPPSTAQQMQVQLISFVSNSDIFNPFSPNSNWEKLTWNVVDGFFVGSRKKEYTVAFCLNPHFVFWRSANVTYVPSRVYVPLEWEFCVSDLKTCPRGW